MKISKIHIFKGTVRELFKTLVESTESFEKFVDRNFAKSPASETPEIMRNFGAKQDFLRCPSWIHFR